MTDLRDIPINPANRRRAWSHITDGEWWRARNAPAETWTNHAQENNVVRMSARQWGARHGYRSETRTEMNGRVLLIRFTPAR